MADDGAKVACALCGAAASRLPLTGSTSVERGGRSVTHCDRCSREKVRSIAGRLDPEWW